MHRTQISLREEQYRRLLEASRSLGTSLAELIRRSVDEYLERNRYLYGEGEGE